LFWHGLRAFGSEPDDCIHRLERAGFSDSQYEILVNKLCTLLHRAEIRDLVDLRALLERGGDLGRALRDASKKDGGFSPIMLGHLLHGFPLERQAKIAGLDAATTAALEQFRVDLTARIAKLTRP